MDTKTAESKLNSALTRRDEARVAFERAKQRLEAAEQILSLETEKYLKFLEGKQGRISLKKDAAGILLA